MNKLFTYLSERKNWTIWFVSLLVSCILQINSSHAQTFASPGVPFTQADLDQLKANINTEPWLTGYNSLKGDSHSQLSYAIHGPYATVTRAPNLNNSGWLDDMIAIHNLAFMYVFTGDSTYARKATNMLDAWAVTNTTWGGGENMLDIGDRVPYFVAGADILRSTFPGWTAANDAHVNNYFRNVLFPTSWSPYPTRDANKGALQCAIAIGISAYLKDPVLWKQALEVYRMDAGGGLRNSLPNGEVGDSGRDDHWFEQIQALGWSAEVAWKQGVDVFAEFNNRLYNIGELYSRYSQSPAGTIPFIPFGAYASYWTNWGIGPGYVHRHPFNNIIKGAYALRKGIPTPYTEQIRALAGEDGYSFLYLKSSDTSHATPLIPVVYPADSVQAVSNLTSIDIGNPGLAGSTSFNNGLWTVNAAGTSTSTAFSFNFKKISGNAGLIVKVNSMSLNTGGCGVMLRQSLAPGSTFWDIFLKATGGVGNHWQPKAPWWLKIERVGTRIFAYHSQDGISWTNLSCWYSATGFPTDLYAGFYTLSNNASALNTATFSNVAYSQTAPAGSPDISSATTATATLGAPFSYNIIASGNPSSYSASGLPAGLSLDAATGIISGTPTTLGQSEVAIAATNASGTGTATLILNVINGQAPAAPVSAVASVVNTTQIQLTWAASANATSYAVKRALTSGGAYTTIQTGVIGTSFTDASPVPEVNNYYVITALTGNQESSNSNEVFASVPPAAPAQPTLVNKNKEIDLSWNAASGASTYNVKRATISGGPYTTVANVAATSYTDLNVSNGSPYYYVVSSVGQTKESANSTEVFGVPGSTSSTWSPNATTGSFSQASNWLENAVPVNPSIITFPSSADTVLTNDINGLVASRIQFNAGASNYTISGNTIHLKNDLINNAAATHTISTPVVLDTLLNVNTANGGGTIAINSTISGTGSLLKTGIGYLYLSGANTYSGNTTLNGNGQSWPPVYGMEVSGTSTGAPSAPTSGPLGTGTIIMNGGALFSSGGDATLYNDIVIAAGKTSYFYQTSNALNLYGKLTGSGTIIQDGNVYAGLHLFADNSGFTGYFVDKLRSGNNRLKFETPQSGSANALWNLDANGNDCIGLTFATGTLNFGGLSGRGAIRYDGPGGGSPVISIGALNTDSYFGGTMTGSLNVEKVGTAVLAFSGNQNYSGTTTVKNGKFLINNSPTSGIFGSIVNVQAGSLGGTGLSQASATIGTGSGTGALLEPGNQAIGTLTVAALTLNQDATYKAEIKTSDATGDKVVASAVNLVNNPKLVLAPVDSTTLAMGTSFTLMHNTGTTAISGTFKNLPELSLIKVGNFNFRITYKGGTGNDVVLLDDRTTPVTITSALTDTVLVGRAMTYNITAIQSPNHFSASGLPAGLSIDTLAGVISGTPTQSGTFSVTLTATNGSTTGTATLVLTVQSNIVSGLLVAAGDTKDILEWTPISNLTYNVKRATTSGGPYTTIAGNLSAASYTDATATDGTTYYYVVTSINGAVESSNSTEVVAKPNIGQKNYYKFDEASGTKAIDSWGANHAALTSAATRTTGISGQALSLNGTANAYATLPAGILSTTNNFTISAWVKQDVASTWGRVFDFGTGTTNYMFMTPKGSTGFPRFAITTGSGEQGINGTSAMSTGVWTNMAVTQSGSTAILYINGVEVGRNTAMTLTPSSMGNTTQNWIGRSQFSADPYLTGEIDEFKIYTRALSASEILAAVNAALPPAPTGLTATGANQVSLSWTATTGASGYNVKRSTTSGGPYTTIASNITTTNYVDAATTSGGPYYYVVTEITGSLESLPSAQATITLVPTAPTSVIATNWNGRVDLSWNASSGATGYTISSVANGIYTPVATTTSLTYSVTGLTNGTPYSYVISGTSAIGTGPYSASATATPISQPTVNTVWTHADIGTVGQTGNAGYAGGMTLYGSGADIWGNADAFHYNYQQLTGDGAIVAHVASLQSYGTTTAISGNAKAAIMMRATLLANSIHATVDVTPTVGIEFIRRTATAGSSTSNSTTGVVAPYWEKLTRAGNIFTAYRSTDGNNWTLVGTAQTITMPSTIYVGLAACAHNASVLVQAKFDTVSISSAIPKITSSKTASGTYGSAFVDTIKASNLPYHFSASGLPGGLSMNAGNGVISGTPLAAGTFSVIVSAINATGNSGGTDTLKLTINKASQLITYNTLAAKKVNDADFSPLATASSGLAVSYSSSDTTVATIVNGKVHIKAAGTSTITAVQAGNSNYAAATPVAQLLTVAKNNQAITFNALAQQYVGAADLDPLATATSGLPISYSSSDTTIASIVNGKVHIKAAGSTVITASQSGNAVFAAASPVDQTLAVVKNTQTIAFNTLPVKSVSDTDFVTGASVSSGLPLSYTSSDSTVAVVINGKIHINGAGSTAITASQSGNAVFAAASPVDQTLAVVKNTQTITFNALPVKNVSDTDFVTGAFVSSGLPLSYSSSDSTVAVVINGKIHINGAGSTAITASQSGNAVFTTALSVSQTLTVIKNNQTITFNALAQQYVGAADLDPLATATSGLPIGYSSADTTIASIINGKVHIKAAGSTAITASQAGNAMFAAAASVDQTLTVIKNDQSITFNAIPQQYVGAADLDSLATVTSGLPVSYSSSDTTIASIINGKVHIKAAGSTVITASQAGNAMFAAATSVDQTLTVIKNNQMITFNAIAQQSVGAADLDSLATSSSGLPVSYSSSDTTIASIINGKVHIKAAGTSLITASQAGNAMFAAATSVNQTLTVIKKDQAIIFNAIPQQYVGAADMDPSASSTSGLPVNYSSSDTTIASIVNNKVHIKNAGTAVITASQNGNNMYAGAISVGQTLTVVKNIQAITFNALPVKNVSDTDFVTGASVSSGLTLSYASSDTTVAVVINGKVHINGAGSTAITASQNGNYAYLPASPVTQSLTVNKLTQTITFNALPAKRPGDADIALTAAASSGLPVAYTSSNVNVATVLNGIIHVTGVGTTVITANQPGNGTYKPASAVQTFTVLPYNLQVQYLDGDNNKLNNNVVRPYIRIANLDSVSVAYNQLTIRYWFTAENYAGINTWIDYAQLGNSNITMSYVALAQPRSGALGYIEYKILANGNIAPNSNSGPIQSRFANQDWSVLNEADDYSYQSNTASYVANPHITLYRNGALIWGTEPDAVTPVTSLSVTYQNQNKNTDGSSISTYLSINNTGNVPVAYGDITARYWFTAEGTQTLNFWKDYVKLGNSNVNGTFTKLNPVRNMADTYLELTFNGAAGNLYPLSNTGNIQYRISKSDWSAFNEANDFSYAPKAAPAENTHITLYYKGQLIYGVEPGIGQLSTMELNNQPKSTDGTASGSELTAPVLFPNPVTTGNFSIRLTKELINKPVMVRVADPTGRLILTKQFGSDSGDVIHLTLPGTGASGVYVVKINDLPGMKLLVVH